MKRHYHEHSRDALHCKQPLALLGLLLFCAATLLISSCNLLKTRTPQNPVTPSTTNPPANSPTALLNNFISAVTKKDAVEYAKLFSDTASGSMPYTFVPAQSSAIRYTAVFSRWTKDSEQDYFQKAMASLSSGAIPSLVFLSDMNSGVVMFQSDSAVFQTDYVLFVPHTQPNLTTTFKGNARFYMAPNITNTWAIYRWEDFETAKDSSWSELKGQFEK
ncbi:MAG: hypothetical protein KGJ59_10420 [Bacteroidota bacterium]|nr:hypothetical protein [Bacteroidota bacterium]